MARRAHGIAPVIVEEYDGDTAAIWTTAKSGETLYKRVSSLPGFATEKSHIFVALLAKRFDVKPRGWKAAKKSKSEFSMEGATSGGLASAFVRPAVECDGERFPFLGREASLCREGARASIARWQPSGGSLRRRPRASERTSRDQYLIAHICGDVYVERVPTALADLRVLDVIAEPTRRRILDAVRTGERSVGELVDEVGMAQPGVSRHLKVLRDAGLVEVRQDAQRRLYRLRPEPLMELDAWLEPYRAEWATRLDALEAHLEHTSTPIARTTKEPM